MRPLRDHDVAVVVGMRGRGKTHWVREKLIPKQDRIVAWDPHREYSLRRRVSVDELYALEADGSGILNDTDLSLAVHPSNRLRPREVAEEFAEFADLISMARGFTLVIDEVGLLHRYGAEHLDFVATQSRHWQQPVVFIAQRAVQIPVTAREQASIVVSFCQRRPEDIQALADRIGEPLAAQIPLLPLRKHVEWDEERELLTEK